MPACPFRSGGYPVYSHRLDLGIRRGDNAIFMLTEQDIIHLSELARIKLSAEEIQNSGPQLSAVLSYIDQLSEVDTKNTEPTAQVTGLTNNWRVDAVAPWAADEVALALEEAGEMVEGQLKVKRIL